ncbi:MAG: NAD(P)H-binding protein [Nocardioidaceae bacterium]|nr:NAD(P)H-binding protein [Nocardioidaceae bacterium]
MTILITGGTGKTGSRVARLLTDLGHDVRVASRSSAHRFDWNDESTWDAAVSGCSAAYLTFQPDLGLPGADLVIGRFAARAVTLGCRRLVLLSGRGEDGARKAERAMVASDADWTIVRSAFFLQNFTESVFAAELAQGSLTMVEHPAAEPFIDADDIADVVVTVLLDEEYTGTVLELTGPELLTFADVAERFGATYRSLPVDAYVGELVAAGLPAEDATGLAYLFADVLDGRNEQVTSEVPDVLGRPARTFAEFLVTTTEVSSRG